MFGDHRCDSYSYHRQAKKPEIYGDELKNASKLIVGPGQGCIFVYEGKVKAVLNESRLVNLETGNNEGFCSSSKRMFFENRSVYEIHEDRRKPFNAKIGQKDHY
jgi:membrane protease subunit (stomatin/prohibitin family)